jgi:hypothetical protein
MYIIFSLLFYQFNKAIFHLTPPQTQFIATTIIISIIIQKMSSSDENLNKRVKSSTTNGKKHLLDQTYSNSANTTTHAGSSNSTGSMFFFHFHTSTFEQNTMFSSYHFFVIVCYFFHYSPPFALNSFSLPLHNQQQPQNNVGHISTKLKPKIPTLMTLLMTFWPSYRQFHPTRRKYCILSQRNMTTLRSWR